MLHQPGRPHGCLFQKLNSFSGEAAQHGLPLQTPLVSLINPHTMLGCLYGVRGVWRRVTCQYPTQYLSVQKVTKCSFLSNALGPIKGILGWSYLAVHRSQAQTISISSY